MSDFFFLNPLLLLIDNIAVSCGDHDIKPEWVSLESGEKLYASWLASNLTPAYVDKQACVVKITHDLKLANARLPARLAQLANQLAKSKPCSAKSVFAVSDSYPIGGCKS